jgi:diaminopimelate epimerase
MAHLSFFKMQGCGNDFILIDNRKANLADAELITLAPDLCNRKFGIGADGILVLKPADKPSLDYTMFYRNSDGSDAGMCGNGARCLALFAQRSGLGSSLLFDVHHKIYKASVEPADNYVWLTFPMQLSVYSMEIAGEPSLFQANAGTEHIVLEVSAEEFVRDEELKKRGAYLRRHKRFRPRGTNVNFICCQETSEIRLKTYERGVEDLTLACGTGAIASAISRHSIKQLKEVDNNITVQTDGGVLNIRFRYNPQDNSYSDIQLGGKAQFVFEGEWGD